MYHLAILHNWYLQHSDRNQANENNFILFLLCRAKLVAVPRVTRNQITQLWRSYLISADRNTSHRNVCLLAWSRWNNSLRKLYADKLAGVVFLRTGTAIMTTSSRARQNWTFTSNNHTEMPMPVSNEPLTPPKHTHPVAVPTFLCVRHKCSNWIKVSD